MRSHASSDIDITSIGAAAFDVFVRAPHEVVESSKGEFLQFPLGAKIKIEHVLFDCGGGAANTSVGFSRLGLRSQFCGVIGDDEWGQSIQKTLQKEGVSIETAIIVENETSSFSIILVDPHSGQRTVLYLANVNAHLSDPVFPKEKLTKSTWIFLNHLSDSSSQILNDLCDVLCEQSKKLAWNPGGSQIRNGFDGEIEKEVLAHTDLLFLNLEEALLFTRTQDLHAAFTVGTRGGAKIMCITDGKKGAFLSDGKIVHSSPPPGDIEVIDTTGCGDAFAVGVTWGVMQDFPLPKVLSAGIINASSVVTKIGTQPGLLTDTELRSRLTTIDLPVTSSPLSSPYTHTDV